MSSCEPTIETLLDLGAGLDAAPPAVTNANVPDEVVRQLRHVLANGMTRTDFVLDSLDANFDEICGGAGATDGSRDARHAILQRSTQRRRGVEGRQFAVTLQPEQRRLCLGLCVWLGSRGQPATDAEGRRAQAISMSDLVTRILRVGLAA